MVTLGPVRLYSKPPRLLFSDCDRYSILRGLGGVTLAHPVAPIFILHSTFIIIIIIIIFIFIKIKNFNR